MTLYGLIAFRLEVILVRAQVRVMSDKKMITKKMLLKEVAKLYAPLIPITGIFMGATYLCSAYQSFNNEFVLFLTLWLYVLDFNFIALYIIYLFKDDLQSPITERRLSAVKKVKIMTTLAHIVTAITIFAGGLALASYLIYLRAVASGLTKVPAPMTSQEAILTVLLLILLPIPAYIVKKKTEKAIRLGRKAT
jgi:hypothetical protein